MEENNVVLPGQMQFFWGDEDQPQADAVRDESSDDMADVKKLKKAAKAKTTKKRKKYASVKKKAQKPSATVKLATAVAKKQKKKASRKFVRPVPQESVTATKIAPPDELVADDVLSLQPVVSDIVVADDRESAVVVAEPGVVEAVQPTVKVKNRAPKTVVSDVEVSSMSNENSDVPAAGFADQVDCFNMKWGARFPKVGFGFWKVDKDKTAEVCRTAIEVGYRHLDCACDYGNEVEVGQGIASAISDGVCDREDLWVTSKLWNTYHAADHVRIACERSLEDLGLDYLDLYLIHFPIAQRFVPFEKSYTPGWLFDPDAKNPTIEEARVPVSETWQAMEELAKSGLVRNIGICNFGTSQIRDLLTYAHIRPAVLQVETHPYLTQEKLLRYCQQEKITYTAFSPLGAQSYFSLGMADPSEAVMEHPVVREVANATGKTVAQVLLRWGVQRGTAVIPKTSSKQRMIENINVFNFELSDAQMAAISALDQNRRFNDPGHFGEAAFNTFLPIYE